MVYLVFLQPSYHSSLFDGVAIHVVEHVVTKTMYLNRLKPKLKKSIRKNLFERVHASIERDCGQKRLGRVEAKVVDGSHFFRRCAGVDKVVE